MVTPNMTKQNFFDELEKKCPDAFKVFSAWIDNYKKENNWNLLFNSNSDYQNAEGKNATAPKFHELPFEMQNGIMARFMVERTNDKDGNGEKYYQQGAKNYRQHVETLFDGLQKAINKKLTTEN